MQKQAVSSGNISDSFSYDQWEMEAIPQFPEKQTRRFDLEELWYRF